MPKLRSLLVFAFIALCAAPASAREPVPFTDAYQDGFALVTFRELSESQVASMLDRIRRSGARHLIIPYWGCQTDIHSSDVGGCRLDYPMTATQLARSAIARGFDVSYLPIVETPTSDWRGLFDPADVAAWFRSYTAWIQGVAREARALGMRELVVGTEMTKLYRYETQWRQVFEDVRKVFDGPLILTVNWDDTAHGFWDAADAIGVSAYYPLIQAGHAAPAAQDELDAAWRGHHDEFQALSRKWRRPIHITEVGYASVSSAALTPWQGQPSDASDYGLQQRCFEAFRKAWQGDRSLVRANVWATEAEDPGLADYLFSFETLGKPAEEVLQRFFGARASLAGGLSGLAPSF